MLVSAAVAAVLPTTLFARRHIRAPFLQRNDFLRVNIACARRVW